MSVESKQELLFLSSEVKNGNILPEKSQFGDKIPNNHQDFWQLWNSHQSYLYNCCLKQNSRTRIHKLYTTIHNFKKKHSTKPFTILHKSFSNTLHNFTKTND
jgi:hypothetical protein